MTECGSPHTGRANGRPHLEVADIFRAAGEAYRQRHALTPDQHKVMAAIETCRTSVLGGHREVCDRCGYVEQSYNSCRNRHCPKCQGLAQAIWIDQRIKRILPTHCFHVVFTIPEELRALVQYNCGPLFNLLFKAAAETLLEIGRDPEWLGGMLGLTAVLHTWCRDLRWHPHLHCIVTGGALAPDGAQWLSTTKDFLFPVHVLSEMFRGKFLCGLRGLYYQRALFLGGRCSHFQDRPVFSRLIDQLFNKPWVVYSKRPFGGPDKVIRYLGRYTHRVAISNQRLRAFEDGQVTFATKNGATVTVNAETFIQRYLLHVLPKGFVKIRHYGLMAPSHATTTLERARSLLEAEPSTNRTSHDIEADPYDDLTWKDLLFLLTGEDLTVCPRCGTGRMVPMALEAAVCTEPNLAPWDTS